MRMADEDDEDVDGTVVSMLGSSNVPLSECCLCSLEGQGLQLSCAGGGDKTRRQVGVPLVLSIATGGYKPGVIGMPSR